VYVVGVAVDLRRRSTPIVASPCTSLPVMLSVAETIVTENDTLPDTEGDAVVSHAALMGLPCTCTLVVTESPARPSKFTTCDELRVWRSS
jgi:hypothetical protein